MALVNSCSPKECMVRMVQYRRHVLAAEMPVFPAKKRYGACGALWKPMAIPILTELLLMIGSRRCDIPAEMSGQEKIPVSPRFKAPSMGGIRTDRGWKGEGRPSFALSFS